jgi:aminoglycoside phosphotransferase (APT) family kinase protein
VHADGVEVSVDLARRLIRGAFPRWAGLPLAPVASGGTDNTLIRLGEDKVARFPRRPSAAAQVEKEGRWLGRLAPGLSLPVPVPIALGRPAAGYPFPWAICPWLEGRDAHAAPLTDDRDAGAELARFLLSLRALPAEGGPPPGPHNFHRGAALAERDAAMRRAISALAEDVDSAALARAWEAALDAAPWDGPPTWIHGDLHPANLLVRGGRLAGVLDFGGLGVGDPACDAMAAWTVLGPAGRADFLDGIGAARDMRAGARGWAVSFAAIAWPYYRDTNPVLVSVARRTIAEALSDEAG